MKKFMALILLAAGLAASAPAAMIKQDTQELGIDGLIDPYTAGGSLIDLNVKYGFFPQDAVEMGTVVGFADDDVGTLFRLGGFAGYNFDTGTEWIPFIGGVLSYVSINSDAYDTGNAIALTFEGGVKYFIAENVALTLTAEISMATDDVFVKKDELTDTDSAFKLGFRFYF